jgi:hypothetical protein
MQRSDERSLQYQAPTAAEPPLPGELRVVRRINWKLFPAAVIILLVIGLGIAWLADGSWDELRWFVRHLMR